MLKVRQRDTLNDNTYIIVALLFPGKGARITYCINVLYNVLESGVGAEMGEDVLVVEECVYEVGVVVESMGETRVDDLQHHTDDLF